MAARVTWGRVVLLGPTGAEIAAWTVSGPGRPDMTTVETLARLCLETRRAGGRMLLRDLDPDLADLLDLAGLRREVIGEPECGEQIGRVEERVEPGDPIS